ncbi:MAG: hypothetical protein MUF04_13135, partial [Akkermansiaceae bacterium]|nr:hypothetical protein [Akkermansiaceae bacterium]
MTRKLPLLTTLAPAALLLAGAAAAPPPENPASQNPERINIAEILKPGTELLGMTVPRYDEMLRLASVVRAEKVVLVEQGLLQGRNIDVRFFDSATRRCLGQVHLAQGTYSQVGAGAPEVGKQLRPALERIRSQGPAVGTI